MFHAAANLDRQRAVVAGGFCQPVFGNGEEWQQQILEWHRRIRVQKGRLAVASGTDSTGSARP
ncbi:hypothetical protein [Mycobacterium kansasii]|uniref:hypothetical protein n=1 Tax=Mycobacterium kansasii TaxID=1768 RepID=UPI001FE834EB|nr:hypothetical protein [Mycobacterium kansasii]